MELEHINGQMKKHKKIIGQMERKMDMEFLLKQMVMYMMACGKMMR